MKINIKIRGLSFDAELNETETAKKIEKILPFATSFSTWGEEIYFDENEKQIP